MLKRIDMWAAKHEEKIEKIRKVANSNAVMLICLIITVLVVISDIRIVTILIERFSK